MQGFTILELLVVVIIAGILATMAGMAWSRIGRAFHGKGAVTDLRNAIVLARADATTRGRYSGFALDLAGKRYLRFIDSTASAVHNGSYEAGEDVLQQWTDLPRNVAIHSVLSSIAATATTRVCGGGGAVASGVAPSGTYAVVFTPEGNAMTAFSIRMGGDSASSDTATISVLPATGLVTLEH